ncbi:MAG: Acyl carrier protein [Lentisphaerae bacterium ADurb.BinA184]|mgnify:CR=1 FL=1|nr:MAG: Acyl carrier protein [Lentisphaerae bacterium ADurb.BinA184]
MSQSVAERVSRVVCEVLKVKAEAVRPGARFGADLGAESIQSVELVAAFEEEFDLDMDEDEALSVQTVGDAVRYIEDCIRRQHG